MKLAIQKIFVRGRRHLFWMFVLAAFTSPLASALEVRGEQVPLADIAVLPPVCKLILVDNPGAHDSTDNAALFERPGYEIAAHNRHIHHYCWALISKQKYIRAHGKIQREFYFKQFMGDIDYVLTNTVDKTWPFFHVLLIEQASMMKMRGDYPNSLLKIDEALRFQPDYDKAYALKSDVYLAMGDKKKAIAMAQTGLEKDPRSRLLRRRLEQLGIKVPPPPPPDPLVENNKENASSAGTAGDSAAALQAKGNDASDGNSNATPPAADASEKNQDKPVAGTGSQPKNNPYCRFCP